jgi:hypothetical protein
MFEDDTRVTLQYSIAVKDLPTEIDRLMAKAVSALKKINTTKLQPSNPEDQFSLKTVARIDTTRKTIEEASSVLGDISNIINGYISYQAKSSQAAPPHPEQPTQQRSAGPGTGVDVNDLLQKLGAFRHTNGLENEEPHTIEKQEV